MERFTRFIPTFGSGQPTQLVPSQTQSHLNQDDDELLGLQRTLTDAQNPRRPVLGEYIKFLRGLWYNGKSLINQLRSRIQAPG
jgi:hypothetical protein